MKDKLDIGRKWKKSGEEDNFKTKWGKELLFGDDDSNKDPDVRFSENAESEDDFIFWKPYWRSLYVKMNEEIAAQWNYYLKFTTPLT